MNITNEQIEKDLADLYKFLGLQEEHKRDNLIDYMWPKEHREQAPIHMKFVAETAKNNILFLSAANRSGKSLLCAFIVAVHALNNYPDWWPGRRFKKCSLILIIAPDFGQMRSGIQKYLVGSYDSPGTGLIPKAKLIADKCRKQPNVPNVFKILAVDRTDQHETCHVEFFSGDGSPGAIAGIAPNLIIIDEPCRPELWREAIMRIMTVDCGGPTNEIGQLIVNFTAVNDYWRALFSEIVPTWQKPKNNLTAQGVYVMSMAMNEVPDFILSPQAKEAIELGYRGSIEYEARVMGWPTPGSGAVFPYDQKIWTCPDFEIPDYWPKFYGLDYGQINSAAVCVALDPNTQTYYVYNEWAAYDLDNATNLSMSLRDLVYQVAHTTRGTLFGVFDPNSATQPVVSTFSSSKGKSLTSRDEQTIIYQLRQFGLNIIRCSVNNVAMKVEKIREGLSTGQIKVFRRACAGTINELKTFMYDEEKRIIKRNDHKVDALGYAMLDCRKVAIYAREDEDEYADAADETRDDITGY